MDVLSTSNLVEIIAVRIKTCDALSRLLGQIDR